MPEKINIVIVDDQRSYRQGISKMLQEYNIHTIGDAENGLAALELLKEKTPHVLLLDLEMPQMDGSATFDMLREKYPFLKIIIISQYDEEELIKSFFNRGAKAYVPKNTDYHILAQAIQDVKTKGIYQDNISEVLNASAKSARKNFYKLLYSRREREIIALLCAGKTVNEMSGKLSISEKTVETHLTEIYKKTKVRGRSEFLIYAIKEGLNYLGA